MSETSIEQIVSREVESFRAYLKADKKSPATIKGYTETVGKLLMMCGKSPGELTPEDLQRFKAHLASKYCENTMYPRVVAVNQYLIHMVHRPDLRIRPPGMVKVTRIPLTESEIKAIREAASRTSAGLRDVALIDVMYYGGLRCAEVSHLTISCLDLDKNRLRVNAGKGKNYDMVNLAPEAVKSLREYIEKGRPRPINGAQDHLFLGRRGVPLSMNQIWKITKIAAFGAGISKNVHPHIFRHSMITHMAEQGLSASFIQAQSRHKSLDMVQRYTHLSEKAVRDAYDRAFTEQEPVRPVPVQPAPVPVKPSDVAYAAPKLTHEDILRARLEGKIDTPTMEAMLGHVDGMPMTTPKMRGPTLGYY